MKLTAAQMDYLKFLARQVTVNDTLNDDPKLALGDIVDHDYSTAYGKGYNTGETNLARALLEHLEDDDG